jgi:thioredoxin-like negative regulator of GroEL
VPSPAASAAAAPGGDPGSADAAGSTARRNGIAWYEDRAEAAFAAARRSGKRVVLDLWAPWCHTCLSMQNFVLTAENLPNRADRFVWLAIDTEREQNASLLEHLPVSVWPTFYVVDPSAGTPPAIHGRWLGAASAEQFARFLDESDRSAVLAGRDRANDTSPEAALAQGDALAAGGDLVAAAAAYATALQRAPADWSRRPETLVAQITALYKAKDYRACLDLGRAHEADTGLSASAVDFAAYALECADETPSGSPGVAELRRALVARLTPLCERGSAELSPDDRADACAKLASARGSLDDTAGARRATLERLAVLESAAAGKPPEIALTHDWARTDALIALGRADEALALASQRERELPNNYNPPHYRAKSLKALGRWQEGLDALERALSLAYGPRRIGLLTLKVDLLLAANRTSDASAVLNEQLAAYRALPPGQRQPAAEARVEQRLRDVSGRSPAAPNR